MKSFLLMAVCSVSVMVGCNKESLQAVIEMEGVHQLGSVQPGTTVEFSIPIKNRGRSALVFSAIEVSCACTIGDFEDKQLLPGQQTQIKGRIATSNLEGHRSYRLSFRTNDPKNAVVHVALEADQKRLAKTIPAALALYGPPDALPYTKQFRFEISEDMKGLEALRVTSPADFLSVEVLSQTERGGELRVTIAEACPNGELNCNIPVTFKIKGGVEQTIPLHVGGVARESVSATPPALMFSKGQTEGVKVVIDATLILDACDLTVVGKGLEKLLKVEPKDGNQLGVSLNGTIVQQNTQGYILVRSKATGVSLSIPVFVAA